MIAGPFRLYAHDTHDSGERASSLVQQGLDEQDAEAFAACRPLYEVEFTFVFDTDAQVAYCVGVDLGDGEPFTRSYPGQQLSLLEE